MAGGQTGESTRLRNVTLATAVMLTGLLAAPVGATYGNPPPMDGPVNDHGEATVTMDGIAIELDFYFAPTFIRTSSGGAFTANIHNEGTTAHTFAIEQLDIDEVLRPGEQRTVEIAMADRAQLIFLCTFHAGRGMRGEFYT